MKITHISFKIASWTLLIGGLIHSSSDLLAPETPERIEIMQRMKGLTSEVLSAEFNMFSFFQGFSLMMGLLLFGYGALNLFILKNIQQNEIPSNVLLLNTIITLVSVMLSVKYFFILPVILTSTAFLGFLVSLITKNKKQ